MKFFGLRESIYVTPFSGTTRIGLTSRAKKRWSQQEKMFIIAANYWKGEEYEQLPGK
jgi:hypothetical protein